MSNGNNSGSNFDVMAMVNEYASANNVDPSDIFAEPETTPEPEPVQEETAAPEEPRPGQMNLEEPQQMDTSAIPIKGGQSNDKNGWVPDADLLEGLDEFQPAVYHKDEIKNASDEEPLKNIFDEDVKQEARETMDSMHRIAANIEDCKKRRGYLKLKIPPGQYHASITAAAEDTNYARGQAELDKIFDEIEQTFPQFILERVAPKEQKPAQVTGDAIVDVPSNNDPLANVPPEDHAHTAEQIAAESNEKFNEIHEVKPNNVTKIVIDKTQAPEISWTPEELESIKRSRTVELNIVESADIAIGEIEDADQSAIDKILAPYKRKVGDVVVALPCSRYRATITGLTYTEVMDLSNSEEMNNLDGERKKWAICFDHIHNPSIGPWTEYKLYKDPATGMTAKVDVNATIPENVDQSTIRIVSKFEDFLRKTSYLDLNFLLWKILCATAMEKEIITIDCHAVHDGVQCGNTYDWVYAPSDLLKMESILPEILEELKETGTASTTEDIWKIYNSSPVAGNSTAKLASSGIIVQFGHISAFEYLDSVYAQIKSLEDAEDDPTLTSRGLNYMILTVLLAFLIPKEDGSGYIRITGSNNLLKVLEGMDEIDWQTMTEIVRLMTEPYQFEYSLRDIVCPKCHNKSDIQIDNMERMLFIVARSLSSVNVVLKKA